MAGLTDGEKEQALKLMAVLKDALYGYRGIDLRITVYPPTSTSISALTLYATVTNEDGKVLFEASSEAHDLDWTFNKLWEEWQD